MKVVEMIPEEEIKNAVLGDYERKIILSRLADERFKKKYCMSFEEFEKKNIVREKRFSWDVEKDAMEWEHAVEGIRYFYEKIDRIRDINNEN